MTTTKWTAATAQDQDKAEELKRAVEAAAKAATFLRRSGWTVYVSFESGKTSDKAEMVGAVRISKELTL